VKVGVENGQFIGELAGREQLAAATTNCFRVMERSNRERSNSAQESAWSLGINRSERRTK
jgi:hypothetical protein